MAWTQHILTIDQYLAAGGEPPDPEGFTPGEDTVVIVCLHDTTGKVAWVSYANEADQPAAERLNPDLPAEDYR